MATTHLDKDSKNPVYRRFVPDQVLTATQLNDVIDHFERQDRLTRVCLSGVGIVCGMKVNFSKNTSISVSKGCAVTTDGDLISFLGATYTMMKEFKDVEAKYPHFNGVTLIEILRADQAGKSGVEPLDKVEGLENMVVVLYLEYFSKEETPCTSTDCDTQGEGQSSKIRMLLMTENDAERISNKDHDSIFDGYNKIKKWIELPAVSIKNVVLKNNYLKGANGIQVVSENSNTSNYYRLQDSYRKAIQDTTVITDLKNGINKIYMEFNSLLNFESSESKAKALNDKITSIFNFSSKSMPLDIQYRYDLLKDVVDTYQEIKCLLFDLRVVCCPNINAFPKHLLLGELNPVEKYLQYRHDFYPSPIIPHGAEKAEEIKSLMLRMHNMLDGYKIPDTGSAPIKITPSRLHSKKLGQKALPYYYASSPKFIEHWNYDKTKTFKAIENLGYHTTHLSESDAIQNPLDYNMDHYDFYRIEGHLGKDYRDAIRQLDDLKTDKGLAFDIKVLSIDETIQDINPKDYDCEFEDLNVMLKAWRAEQNCLNAGISKFFSGFSLKKQGEHKFYKLSKSETITRDDTIKDRVSPETHVATGTTSNIAPIFGMYGANIPTYSQYAQNIDLNRLQTPKVASALYKLGAKFYNFDTVILDNLEKDEDVLGNMVDKAIREKPEGSAEDIVAVVRKNLDGNADISNWDANNKEIALFNPAEILAYTKVASRFIPNDIVEIDAERIQNYEKNMKNLCRKVERFKKDMTTLLYNPKDNVAYKRVGYEEQYGLLLNQISVNCCAAQKMKSLLAEIETRKQKILEQKLLSKFVEKHSGLEHKAGVNQGGTFILVYKGGKKGSVPKYDPAVFGSAVQFPSNLGMLGLTPLTHIAAPEFQNIVSANDWNISRIPKDLLDLQDVNLALRERTGIRDIDESIFDRIRDRVIQPPISNISENTVVADFILPYICCSDCSPIVFVVPKASVSLRLPVDFVCLDEETKPLAFEVSPTDGKVAAEVGNDLNGGVSKIEDSYYFDPKLVSEALIGQEINFKVNEQFTDCKITVYKKPEFDFVASEPTYYKQNMEASVNFTVKGDQLPIGVIYEWDFGDATLSANNSEENPRHHYQLKPDEEGKQTFKVSLKVTNGRCSHMVIHDLEFAPEQVTFNIAEEVCLQGNENNSTEVPFEVSPKDQTVKLAEDYKYAEIKEHMLVLHPGFAAFNKPISFTVNGTPVSATCTPRIRPQLEIVPPPQEQLYSKAGDNTLVVSFGIKNLNGFDEEAQDYKWEFGDGKEGTGKFVQHTYEIPEDINNNEEMSFHIKLVVSSKVCEVQTFETKITILVSRLI